MKQKSNRDILYRAKEELTNEWLYGFPVIASDNKEFAYFFTDNEHDNSFHNHITKIETIGQYAGRRDIHGIKIFEGDIVKCMNYHGNVSGTIAYNNDHFYLSCDSGYSDEYLFNCHDFEIVGNIFDEEDDDDGRDIS